MAICYPEGREDRGGVLCDVTLILNQGFAWREYHDAETGALIDDVMCDEDEEEELYAAL